jgi:outer membrane receptor protein involved in Fe transport
VYDATDAGLRTLALRRRGVGDEEDSPNSCGRRSGAADSCHWLGAVAVAGGTGQSSAEAQAAPASEADDQEILVTAQRREQRLQDVPLSVTALSGDTLAERGINDITTLSTSVPG